MTSPFTIAAMPSITCGSAAMAQRQSGESCRTKPRQKWQKTADESLIQIFLINSQHFRKAVGRFHQVLMRGNLPPTSIKSPRRVSINFALTHLDAGDRRLWRRRA